MSEGDSTSENRRRSWKYRRIQDLVTVGILAVIAITAGVTSVTVVTQDRVFDCRLELRDSYSGRSSAHVRIEPAPEGSKPGTVAP